MQPYEEYYSNPENLKKIVQYMKYREVVVLKHLPDRVVPIRPLKIFKLSHLQYWVDRLGLTTIASDIYISNASVRLPPLPSSLFELKEARAIINQKWVDWLEGKDKEFVTGFDIFTDVDIENESHRPKAKQYAQIIYNQLKEKGYKPQMWDTSRGYHVIVQGRFQPNFAYNIIENICRVNNIPTNTSFTCKDCGELFYTPARDRNGNKICPKCGSKHIQTSDKPFVDLSVTADMRRVRRCPYSLHSKTGKPMVKKL